MSIHPSLSLSEKGKKSRSVLSRRERIKIMLEKGEWQEGKSIYGLPKIKVVKMKIKKESQGKGTDAKETTTTATSTSASSQKSQKSETKK